MHGAKPVAPGKEHQTDARIGFAKVYIFLTVPVYAAKNDNKVRVWVSC